MSQEQEIKIRKALAHLRNALTEANPLHEGNHVISIKDCTASVNGDVYDITWDVDILLRNQVGYTH